MDIMLKKAKEIKKKVDEELKVKFRDKIGLWWRILVLLYKHPDMVLWPLLIECKKWEKPLFNRIWKKEGINVSKLSSD